VSNELYGHLDPIEELKTLIREAVAESERNTAEIDWWIPNAPAFAKITPQTYFRDTLAEVLTTSDALYILDGLVNGDDE
jgi:hypothetical protein